MTGFHYYEVTFVFIAIILNADMNGCLQPETLSLKQIEPAKLSYEIRSFVHSILIDLSLIHPIIRSFVHALIQGIVHLSVRSIVRLLLRRFIHSLFPSAREVHVH